MKSPLRLLLTAALILGLGTTVAGATTLTGTYNSGFQDRPQRLSATFTATGEETYDVYFDFRFNGRDLRYSGTAEGSLTDGELSGRVTTANGGRTFTFRVDFEDKEGEGRHAEVKRGKEVDTGPLTLKH